MKVTIELVDHKDQRYPTVGDWFYENGDLEIRVSKLSDWRYEMLIAVHELVEVLTCRQNGILQGEVDQFDKEYEKNRSDGDDSEPGDDPKAPYRNEHCLATGIERILAQQWGVCWKEYEEELNSLP